MLRTSVAAGRSRWRSDEGSTLVLTLILAGLSLVLILIVAFATTLYIERKQLFTVADAAALAAAESFKPSSIDPAQSRPFPVLTNEQIVEAVEDWINRIPGSDGIAIVQAGSRDGSTAEVTLRSTWFPPFLTFFAPRGIAIEVTATARVVFLDE
ncbi:pilus assembly protein TadG-related protein [Humidisolicoccus flavus]|uniref:pilus assembly protein TadG-related protein n=1 Tax=Humidisolicoccus flavus TaxID=3111414 RepID=UPI00324543EB